MSFARRYWHIAMVGLTISACASSKVSLRLADELGMSRVSVW